MKKIMLIVASICICCSCYADEDVDRFVDDKGMTHFIGKKSEAEVHGVRSPEAIEEYIKDHPERSQFAIAIRQNRLVIGMNSMEAGLVRGWSIKVNKTVTAYGVSEQWCYASGDYLYFDNGILTAWQDSN